VNVEEILYFIRHNLARVVYGQTLALEFVDVEALTHALKHNTSLTVIDIPAKFPGNAAEMLADILHKNSTITSISLSGRLLMSAHAQGLADAIKGNTSLTALNLSRFEMRGALPTLAVVKALQVHNTYTFIGLDYSSMKTESDKNHKACIHGIAKALHANTSLAGIDITFPRLYAADLLLLAGALKVNVALTSLRLMTMHASSEGIASSQYLVEALCTLPRLTSLDLDRVFLDASGAKALASLIAVNTSLAELGVRHSLRHAPIHPHPVLTAMKNNSTLMTVSVPGNQLLCRGARTLAAVLRNHPTLTKIDISYNRIQAPGMRNLAAALSINNTLLSIDLSGNTAGAAGSQALAKALQVNTVLKKLSLSWAHVDGVGAQALAAALLMNTSLVEIDLSHNDMGTIGLNALTSVLKKNTSLTSINFSGAATTSLLVDAVAEILHVNTALTSINIPPLAKTLYFHGVPCPRRVVWNHQRVLEKALQGNVTLINILGADVNQAQYGRAVYKLFIRNRRRLLLVNDRDGLKNTILNSLFSKPLQKNATLACELPAMIKLQLTKCAIKLQLLDSDIMRRAVMLGWCFSSLEQGLDQVRYTSSTQVR
jgi:Ran GTPase-activating protein (RanGAP) involved in mRNA processing and transport